ncbi:hypothetical protein C8Q78DRAFT_1073923 [Trametes maxima]|nr:hypothetical protein C8Q78DRAFT_1073923 [Trametes maxima]
MAATESAPQPAHPNGSFTVTTAPPSGAAAPAQNEGAWPSTGDTDRPWLTFPPFPKPPPGVDLISFSDFKPTGIVLVPETADAEPEQVERDGLGIPTVALRVRHDLTSMDKRKRKKTRVGQDGTVRSAPWYEEWAEDENTRRMMGVVDPSVPRIDRLHQAAHDFKHGRPLHTNQELSHLWDRWRLFLGLISSMQPPASRKKHAAMRDALAAMAEAPADDDDDDEDEMPNARPPKAARVVVTNDEEGSPAQPPPNASKPVFTEEQRQQRREYFREVRDTRMDRFLNDPEKTVKIFLSGYYRDRGLSMAEKSCRDGPLLLGFFLNFLLRNRVFPECEKGLRKAVAITEQARTELLHCFVVCKAIPDLFSNGCELVYGTMTHSTVWLNTDAASSGEEDEPDAKRQKTDGLSEAAFLQAAVGQEPIEVIGADTVMKMEMDAKDVLVDADVNGEQPASVWATDIPSTASASAPAWGDPDVQSGEGVSWGEANAQWGAPEDASIWDTGAKTNALHDLLGPTVLPLTHTTGVIERSTRRIKSVTLPAVPPKGKNNGTFPPGSGPDAGAVERDLETRLARVVLIPWHEWDAHALADVKRPRILPASRGAVVSEENEGTDADTAAAEDGTAPPHNPFKDEITVLVTPTAAEQLMVGFGVEASWIQLAHVDPAVPIVVDEEEFLNPYAQNKKRIGGPGVPVAPSKYWYMEQVLNVLPSYHTEMVPLPTTEEVFGPNEV